jgi:biopolymer transport protein ExbD
MRRKKRHRQEDVELNLCAMLDMAFQLLTFFILTFRPAPIEGQVLLRMPPPVPVTNINTGQRAGSDTTNTNPIQGLNTLVITATSQGDGRLGQMSVGDISLASLAELEGKLASAFGTESGFDQVVIQVDSRLQYDDLMKIIEVCTRQTLPNGEPLSKLSFVELPATAGG